MKKTVMILALAAFITGCKQNTADSDHAAHTAMEHAEHAPHDHDHDHEGAPAELELNNGEKWTINPEMVPMLEQEQGMLIDIAQNGDGDYKAAAELMKKQNDELIKSCTMEGKGHEELHKWLTDHRKAIDVLGAAKNSDEAQTALRGISLSFVMFHRYFQ